MYAWNKLYTALYALHTPSSLSPYPLPSAFSLQPLMSPCPMEPAEVGLPYLGQALALRFRFLQIFPVLLPFHHSNLNATSQRPLLTTLGRAALLCS